MANHSDVGSEPVRWSGSRIFAYAALFVAGAVAAALVVVGILQGPLTTPGVAFIAAGGVGLVVVLALVGVVAAVAHRSPGLSASSSSADLEALTRAIDRFSEQSALSDDARRVLNRQRERDLLRAAIEEDISAQDWDAAMVLVRELAERFGYRADAEEFRQQIEQARFETTEQSVADAVSRLDGLIVQRRWEQAIVEAGRIGRLYPESPRVEGLRHRVEAARQTYKQDLERRFLDAAQADQIDDAMILLKELDAYLTEAEAGPFREVARGVIGKARDNLGAQFKIALQDRRWGDAIETGERIITEFPNSRMSVEVRTVIDGLRSRAAETAAS
jgi:hypothetical protein